MSLIVGATGHWKRPITYLLQDKCAAHAPTQVIRECLLFPHLEGMVGHDRKIQRWDLSHCGMGIFNSPEHYFEYSTGQEPDQLSSF